LTQWIGEHSDEAKALVNAELKRETGKPLRTEVLDEAWGRVTFTADPIEASLAQMVRWAFDQGFLGRRHPDVSQLVDRRWLNGASNVAPAAVTAP
jgi:NitT/TauT family transport system substrate-binding protein